MTYAPLAAFAAATAPKAAEQQLLDVDGTVFVMLGLFLLMLVFLTVFLWKPYLRVRQERGTRVDGYREQAAQMEADAKTRLDKVQADLAEARRLGAGELAVARAEAQARERTLMATATTEAQRTLADARGKLDAAIAAQKAGLQARATELGRQAAGRVLGRSLS